MRRSIVLATIGPMLTPLAHATFSDACWFYVLGIRGVQLGNFYGICGEDQVHTYINLNKCLFNNDGQLFFQSNGGALDACTCVSRTNQTQFIDCQCKNIAGEDTPASIDLDVEGGIRFDSDKGVFTCLDQVGSKDSVATALDFPILADGTINLY